MNDDFGGPPQGGAVRRPTPQHLDTDALSAVLDGRLDPDSLVAARAHVAVCADCRRELDELRTTVSLLHGLPQYRPRRSFALGAAYAKTAHASRLARLLPFLPVLRTATAVVALLLAVVTGADVLIDDEPAPATSTDLTTVEAVDPAVSAREPTGRDARSGDQDAPVDQAAGESGADQVGANEAAPAEEAPELADAAGAPAVEPAAPGLATDAARGASSGALAEGEEAPVAQAQDEELAGDGAIEGGEARPAFGAGEADDALAPEAANAAPESSLVSGERSSAGRVGDDGLSAWQFAQIGLGVALVGLVVLLVAVQRLAAHTRRLDPGF